MPTSIIQKTFRFRDWKADKSEIAINMSYSSLSGFSISLFLPKRSFEFSKGKDLDLIRILNKRTEQKKLLKKELTSILNSESPRTTVEEMIQFAKLNGAKAMINKFDQLSIKTKKGQFLYSLSAKFWDLKTNEITIGGITGLGRAKPVLKKYLF